MTSRAPNPQAANPTHTAWWGEGAHPLRRLRFSRAITQRWLAGRSGVSCTTIQLIERGRTHPRMDTRRKLLRALHLDHVFHGVVFGPFRED